MIDPVENRHKIGLSLPEISVAVEALEQILVENGFLRDGQLTKRIEDLSRTKVLPGGDG